MRLSVVFELLLVFLFLAFAAARVIDPASVSKNVAKSNKKASTVLRQGPPNRYCACTSRMCNCCRDFSLPVVPLKGPGCASIMYVQRDTMMVTMSFGDRVLSNTTISGKTPKPICMALPGGISQFCGRIYGISRKGEQFRACLGLELRALDDIEAALRVSCFKFGPKGVKLESAPPVPAETGGKDPEEEEEEDYDLDDDEDDDLIGFGVDDEDDGSSNEVDSDSVDYTGFSVLGEDLLGTLFSDDSGGSSTKKKKPSKKTVKPQVIVPKVSSTTRRPLLPNRRRSTVRPLSVTKRPLLNRITKTPAPSTVRPIIIQKPLASVVPPSQATLITAFSPSSPTLLVTKNDFTTAPASPSTTEPPSTTARTTITTSASEKEVTSTLLQTEEPITFTVPTQNAVKNDIKLPQIDLEKVEAVAAIAQQLVPSGVISSGSMASEEVAKPLEAVTASLEKVTPTHATATTPSYASLGYTQKISSIKFIPTAVVTSRPSAEEGLSDETATGDVTSVSEATTQETGVKYEVHVESSVSEKYDSANATGNVKKQSVKKGEKGEEEEEDEEEEEEEDLLEGVLSDDDDSDNDETEDTDSNTVTTSGNKNKVEADEEEEEDDEDDILGEVEETEQEAKPTKVTIKKPASDEANNESAEEDEEEEEEEEDILDALSDDDEEEDDEDEEEQPAKKKPTKAPPTTTTPQPTKANKPSTQQPPRTKKPLLTTTEPPPTTPQKVFIYQEPLEKVTQKVVIYQEPQNKVPNKVFIYKDPDNEKTTQKIIFYQEPAGHTEKFVIYKDPEERPTGGPEGLKDGAEETKEDSEEEKPEHDEDSSEEDLEDDPGKHTLMASIIKPGFSNKYAEEHDLTESDDLDIEDSDDDDSNDFEEDRKLKPTQKKSVIKTLANPSPPPSSSSHRIISTSRTHRRMNLDRFLQLQPLPYPQHG